MPDYITRFRGKMTKIVDNLCHSVTKMSVMLNNLAAKSISRF